jgi:hypothetical protein
MKILEKIAEFVLKAIMIILVLFFIVSVGFIVPYQSLREGFKFPDVLGIYFTYWGCYVLFSCVVGCLIEWYEEGFSLIRFPVLRVIMIGLLMLIAGALFLILGEFNHYISLIDLPN